MIAVHLDQVTITYVSEPVINDLSWEIHDDWVVWQVGPNGCGKSTLLQLIAGELVSDTERLCDEACIPLAAEVIIAIVHLLCTHDTPLVPPGTNHPRAISNASNRPRSHLGGV
jgi:energy-coupling factor transporter ATP-binding protein EcfA2